MLNLIEVKIVGTDVDLRRKNKDISLSKRNVIICEQV